MPGPDSRRRTKKRSTEGRDAGRKVELAPKGPEVLVTREEIDFFREYSTGKGAIRALAVARVLNAGHVNIEIPAERQSPARLREAQEHTHPEALPGPELGGFEYHTAEIMARQFEKAIKVAEGLGLGGDVRILVIDNGERRWMELKDYMLRREQGIENLMVAGVVGRLEGDNPEGANILIRNDMDALQMASGEVKHQCGHNVHSGWACMNLDAMLEYKKKFGKLPFKQAVFVSESNEEANPAAGELIAPKEMIDAGFEQRYGQIDVALGAHVIASIPEHTARIEVEGFHGATDFVFQAKPNKTYDPAVHADLELLPFEMARLVNNQFHSDTPNDKFGKRRLVAEDDGKIVPPMYVRLTSEAQEQENLALNSLVGSTRYAGKVNFPITRQSLDQAVEEQLGPWRKLDFEITPGVELDEETGEFSIELSVGSAAHVAFGGPNLRQIMGEILHNIPQQQEITSVGPREGQVRFGGTMRLRLPESERVRDEVATKLQTIYEQAVEILGLRGKVDSTFVTQNSIGPVINDPTLVRQARALFSEAGVALSRVNLPHAGAESFVEYERFFKPGERKAMIYILIGGMKQAEVDHLLESGDPVDAQCVHHSDTFRVQDSSIPYGIALDALAIQYARAFEQGQL